MPAPVFTAKDTFVVDAYRARPSLRAAMADSEHYEIQVDVWLDGPSRPVSRLTLAVLSRWTETASSASNRGDTLRFDGLVRLPGPAVWRARLSYYTNYRQANLRLLESAAAD